MPARVHAVLVVRPNGSIPAASHLERTLDALAAQTRPVDRLSIVQIGADSEVGDLIAASDADEVLVEPDAPDFARAVGLVEVDGDAVWLLAQDTAPAPEALERLHAALAASPDIAVAFAKLVDEDRPDRIVSLGQDLTVGGRTVVRAAGEHDQGQWDGDSDTLGGDVRGMLVRAEAWQTLGGLDEALAGADEGVDLAMRARLAGSRIVVVPGAVVAVAGDGVAGLPREGAPGAPMRIAYAERTAQLHRRLVYAPAWAVVLHWLSLVPLAAVRTLGHLLYDRPARILPEWAACATVLVRIPAVARARRRVRETRTAGRDQLVPLRVRRGDLRRRLDTGDGAAARDDLHFFGGGGAWIVLALLATSVLAFAPLLAWPVLGGGALVPLRPTLPGLWADAASGLRPLGWATTGPADPFSVVVAAIGSLWPAEPSRALVVLWLLAIPLAGLGGWFAATRVSDRALVRALGAVAWGLAPMLLTAIADGRPTGVLVHLLLPWLVVAGAVAHRSWSGAGTASIVLALVVACAPSLAPAFGVLWLAALILCVLWLPAAVARVVWVVVPTLVLFAPLAWARAQAGTAWALLADPGVPAGDGGGTDIVRRLLLVAGFPTSDAAGWGEALGGDLVGWAALMALPLVAAAALACLTRRTIAVAVLLTIAVLGICTAQVVAGLAVTVTGDLPAGMWPGPALSLLWVGLGGAALIGLDELALWGTVIRRDDRVDGGPRIAAVTLVMVTVVVCAFPALTAVARGAFVPTNGPVSTLPAYVDVQGRSDAAQATLVIAPQAEGVAVEVVWGGSATLGGQTTLRSARSEPLPGDAEAARVVASLVAGPAGDEAEVLAAQGVAFVVLSPAEEGDDAARARGVAAQAVLDQRDDLESVGDTGKGLLWRVIPEVTPREATAAEHRHATEIAGIQLTVLAIALLLAVPAPGARRRASGDRRVVGGSGA